ncbi:MAG: division/cell wall cluster transcriptional repressor MraZ [Rhodospirillaceae bacterium]|nr:division/cell wall cluster transcriptional repressor MraZ [Rhodospirillaceae bacterium]
MIFHIVPNTLEGLGFVPVRRRKKTGKSERLVTSFISTYENKVDRKGRVSVPAAYRSVLGTESYQGVIAYPSITHSVIEAFGRGMLDDLNQRKFNQTLDGGDFTQALIGRSDDGLVETVMAISSELPFDGEGRIILPARLIKHAGITDRATFVGRGTRFQVWAPGVYEKHQAAEVEALRAKLSGGGTL